MIPLLRIIVENQDRGSDIETLRLATWTLSNLCRHEPLPELEQVSPCIPVVAPLLYDGDVEVLTDACWTMCYLSDGSENEERIEAVLQSHVAPRLEELLLHSSTSVIAPALRVIGNIATGNILQTRTLVKLGVLPILGSLAIHPKKSISLEACWTISNITAGNAEDIQAVIDAHIIPSLMKHIETPIAPNCEKSNHEAIWALLNAITGGTTEQIIYIVEKESVCVEVFCDVLLNTNDINDDKMRSEALQALSNIVRACREKGASSCYEEIIEQKGLWHHVMYNNFRGTLGYEKTFMDNLRKPRSGSLFDADISLKDEMEDD
ncbi:hypothetical protein FDP41_006438 [Naegleria fowleri]|uniref:IBB domain-containing protein n=1 Tax=Naegleria fowleri TaxID=5763 RepID=A0A6A5BI29_NAEFO|nr:uncharacterized protein FDP41_006438 [Naegleria fowleri]KAF0974406.1 hypothetical protein FDP41_006438 [Naegleria fowleri]CAG4712872.1 unnamed protein product [Naegleria fowleri]